MNRKHKTPTEYDNAYNPANKTNNQKGYDVAEEGKQIYFRLFHCTNS